MMKCTTFKNAAWAVAALLPACAFADYSSASWTADESGNWSGSVFDTAHWGGGEVPGSSATAATRMAFAGGHGDYVVSNLVTAATNSAGLEASVGTGETITFYGRGTTWDVPDGTAHDLFKFMTGGTSPIVSWAADSTAGVHLDNYLVRLSNGASGRTGTWLDIDADEFKLASSSGTMLLFGTWAATGDPSGHAGIRLANADIAIPHQLKFGAFCQMTNEVILSNCRGTFGTGMWTDAWSGSALSSDNDRQGLLEIRLTDGTVVTNTADIGFGYYVEDGRFTSRSKTFRLRIDAGSEFRMKAMRIGQPGRTEVLVSGKDTLLDMYDSAYLANSTQSTGVVEVTEGATLNLGGTFALGPQSAEKVASGWATLRVADGTLKCKQQVSVYNGRVTLENALWTYTGQGRIAGADVTGGTNELVLNGVTLNTLGTDIAPIVPIKNLQSVKIGPRGFVFRAGTSHVVRFNQHFTDLDATQGGELTFVGCQYSKLVLSGDDYSKESTESRLTIAKEVAYLEEGCNHHSYLTVTNGATFSLVSNSDVTCPTSIRLKGLCLGDAATKGTLALKADDLVTVDNDSLELANAKITFSSTLGLGAHTVFRLTQEPTADTTMLWESGAKAMVTSGLDSSKYNSFQVVAEDGVWNCKIIVANEQPVKTGDATWKGPSATWDAQTAWTGDAAPTNTVGAVFAGAEPKEITVSGDRAAASLTFSDDGYRLSGGQVTISDNTGAALTATASAEIASALHLYAVLPVNVAAGETLTISGRILGGGIAKSGEGKLRLENAENMMPLGVSVSEGTVETADPQALGYVNDNATGILSGGKVRFTESGATDARLKITGAVALENVADGAVELRAPEAATSCALTKAGSAPLALRADADKSWPSGMSANTITVDEGALRIHGTASATLGYGSRLYIGRAEAVSESATPAQPGLVLDGPVTLSVSELNSMDNTPSGSSAFATDPYLVITNGAKLKITSKFQPSNGGKERQQSFHMLMDNGTIESTGSDFGLNQASYATISTNYYELRNGSKITSWYGWGRFAVTCPFVVDMDDSVMMGGQSGDPRSCLCMYMGGSFSGFTCTFNVRNGSVFRCNDICYNPWTAGQHTGAYVQPWRFNFEDSEWDLGDASIDMPSSNMNVIVTTKGATGIVFAPPATRTWKVYTRIDGTGAFTKRGEGHLLVDCRMQYSKYTADPLTLANTGAIRVESGTMKIVSGALTNFTGRTFAFANGATLDLDGLALDQPVLTGAGRLLNATYAKPTLSVAVSPAGVVTGAPTIDGAQLTGRACVDFGRDADDPLEIGASLVVAHWVGTKPDVATWRTRQAGKGIGCTYVANDDGSIVATVRPPRGMIYVVR